MHALLSGVLLHTFRTLESCRQLQLFEGCTMHRFWCCCLIQQDGKALFCWAHVHRECTMFTKYQILYYTRILEPIIVVNKILPILSFCQTFISITESSASPSCCWQKHFGNLHKSGCSNPSGLSRDLREKGCGCDVNSHTNTSHGFSTWSVTSISFFLLMFRGTSDHSYSW